MALFKSATHQQVWTGHWCDRCYRDRDACPILAKALRTNRKPPEWDRKPRAQTMADSIKCNEFGRRPPVNHRAPPRFENEPLFEVTPYSTEVGYVPVQGWPEKPGKKGVDHA